MLVEIVICVTILLLRFALFLSELRNAMLLQESEGVNSRKDVEQNIRFFELYDGSRKRNSIYICTDL